MLAAAPLCLACIPALLSEHGAAFVENCGGWGNGFVVRVDPGSNQIEWSTYLEGWETDSANDLVAAPDGGVIVVGNTDSADFPVTAGAFQTAFGGDPSTAGDAFALWLTPDGAALRWSTLLGGTAADVANALTADASGIVTLAGYTRSGEFPLTLGAYDRSKGPFSDSFVARLDPYGRKLLYSTLIHGTATDEAYAIAQDGKRTVTLCGLSKGSDFPTTGGAFQTTYAGGSADAYATRLDLHPQGVAHIGSSTLACLGAIATGVTEMPAAGSTSFELWASAAPQNALALLAVALEDLPVGLPVLGFQAWIDPAKILFVVPDHAGPLGWVETALPLPAKGVGFTAYAQYAFINTPPCGGAGMISATHALAITLQPALP